MPTTNKKPPFRKLKGYAFDPSLSLKIDTAFINNIVYRVPWELDLKPGPAGEYLEVIDFDPTLKKFYKPVDLNDIYILAQDGLDPSESNPQFHQQMVYAVIMTTIKNFESALGRPVLWSPRRLKQDKGKNNKHKAAFEYVKTLRVYPHAFRDSNAYYSVQKKALLFGYFFVQNVDPTVMMPSSQVFTCLSHDIIAHETTHAILDGIYKNYINDTNPDMLAFHEAFADIVALFQHFTFPDVLKNQIAKTRGDLASQNLLGQLAQEFGSAIGKYGALRDAIGYLDEVTKEWKPKIPNGDEYQNVFEPHARGAILVSAVFDAFLTIYKSRVADLLRIATGGTGILPQGELHPDLVNRLSAEASKSAGHILKMCIRALDYSPPLDITFGDYLRAIMTADADLVADDSRDYRIAFIDAFRKRGIYPQGIKNLSVESLCYPECRIKESSKDTQGLIKTLIKFLREFSGKIVYHQKREDIYNFTRDYVSSNHDDPKSNIFGLHRRIGKSFHGSDIFEKLTGLVFNHRWQEFGVGTSRAYGNEGPRFTVHSLKYASRVGPSGNISNQIVISLIQKAGIEIATVNGEPKPKPFVPKQGEQQSASRFIMEGGVTLIFDLDKMELRYAIGKPLIDRDSINDKKVYINEQRALTLYHYYNNENQDISKFKAYFTPGFQNTAAEIFSFLHSN